MRNKEAIEILTNVKNTPQITWTNGADIALDLAIKALEERPQGEWKITDAYPHKVYCDKCYKTYAQENWEVWKDGSLSRNFCPNCGADMRGKEE